MSKTAAATKPAQIQVRLTIDPKVFEYYEKQAQALGISTTSYMLMVLGQRYAEEHKKK